ncbi:MAG: RDD family protein [Longimicrobiaceae bacterium]
MAPPATPVGIDPRKTISPEKFSVAPHLVGLPLASPSRRLAAILLDLLLVAILANVGGKVLFAGLMGLSFFWFAGRKLGKGGTFFSRGAKAALRGVGALMLFVAAIALLNRAKSSVDEGEEGDSNAAPATQNASATGPQINSAGSALTAIRMASNLVAVENAPDSARAFDAARAAVRQMRRLGMTDRQIREALADAADERDLKPWAASAFRAVMPAASDDEEEDGRVSPDSLASLYVSAVHDDDSTRVGVLRPRLASALARDSLDNLRQRTAELETANRELDRKVKEEESRGLLATLLGFFNDLGIGFGWTGLYFTAFTALWRGQTPGKKLLGIRVLRLDGLPMTLWASFERFGGYAAGLFTGLMGYAQVYWDRNRQAIQDKISETVVIRLLPGVDVPVAAPAARPPLPPRPYAGPGYPLPPSPPPAPGEPYPRP